GRLAEWDCRNNRLAEVGLSQDGLTDAVARVRKRYGAERIAVCMATSTSGVEQGERAYRERGASGPLPAWFNHRTTQNVYSVGGYIRARLGLAGPCAVTSTACSSSARVFASAHRLIATGCADAALVGGVDSLCLTTLYGFNALQLLDARVCRPADATRAGLSLGEAAGFALLERDRADSGQLLGYGESSDAWHMSAPQPEGRGAAAAMHGALARAGMQPSDVDHVHLHGTATRANDVIEDQAVRAVFGPGIACSSTKGWTGHTLGAAGIVSAALSLLCLQHGVLPRSLNTERVDPAISAHVLLQTRRSAVRRVMANAFGFGGSNCSLLFGATP
ncbi:MAG TPA: beta-ketoacyl-ACP synthase, partial [Nevskiaceae bacterium]